MFLLFLLCPAPALASLTSLPRREERREGREYKRPCKFWMEKGRCHEEDRCKFPHPMANPR